ncbi:MAG: MiaB/RimO family radical SAM methylthiotransferase [Candidatus Omnitrophota bacterium]
MRTFWIKTLGCKVNQYEGEAIRERLEESGLSEVESVGLADLRIVNTCTVTSRADSKSRNAIFSAIRNKKKSQVLVTGCMAKFDKEILARNIKGIDYIIPKSFFSDRINRFFHKTRAFVKIQDGCNNKCSYCKVSLVRGSSRSRSEKEIITEIKNLLENGFKEIVLAGVCLGSYGADLKSKASLVSLIDKLHNYPELKRIRLSSIEPHLVKDELIKLMANSDKLCRHLHIPLQSADNKILKLMNRNYNREGYLSLISRIRRVIPQIGITTDVLIGFPGEDNKNFQNTLNALRKILPLRVHSFVYSPRQLTKAACLEQPKVDQDELRRRAKVLKQLSEELSSTFRSSFLNKDLLVLAETFKNGQISGYSDNYIRVNFSGSRDILNKIVPIRIENVDRFSTLGSIDLSKITQQKYLSYCYDYSYKKESATLT